MSADGSTMMLAALATVLVLYVVKQESRPRSYGFVGAKKPRASLGKSVDCANVAIDSPDFERCAGALGTGRSVIRSKPRADRLNNQFKKDNYKVNKSLGNPFAVKVNDGFKKDTNKKLGMAHRGEAFPFSESGELPKNQSSRKGSKMIPEKLGANQMGGVRGQKFRKTATRSSTRTEAPSRGSSRSSVALGSTVEKTMGSSFLGAAVSPSSLVATAREMSQLTNKLHDVNEVVSNTGGNLNLLHPL